MREVISLDDNLGISLPMQVLTELRDPNKRKTLKRGKMSDELVQPMDPEERSNCRKIYDWVKSLTKEGQRKILTGIANPESDINIEEDFPSKKQRRM